MHVMFTVIVQYLHVHVHTAAKSNRISKRMQGEYSRTLILVAVKHPFLPVCPVRTNPAGTLSNAF